MQNLNHLVSLLQEGYKTIGVVFSMARPEELDVAWAEPVTVQGRASREAQQKVYTYKCFFECSVGDLVIVPSSSDHKLPSMGQVVRIDDEPELNFESGIEYKWAVAKVDTLPYQEIMDREKKLIVILRDGEKKAARQRLLDSYQLALPTDGDARKIFDQARQIGPTIKD